MRRRRRQQVWLELTSLTDVVFLLLIFFMLSTTFIQNNKNLDIKLPKSKGLAQQEGENTTIEISRNGEVAFNGQTMSPEELDSTLDKLVRHSPDEVIVIKADKDINYGLVVKVMGLCKSKNLNKLGMAALQDKE